MKLLKESKAKRNQIGNIAEIESRYNAYLDEIFIDFYKHENGNLIQMFAFYNTKKFDEVIIIISERNLSNERIMIEEFNTKLIDEGLAIYGNTNVLDTYKQQIDDIIKKVLDNEEELWNDMIKEQEKIWN